MGLRNFIFGEEPEAQRPLETVPQSPTPRNVTRPGVDQEAIALAEEARRREEEDRARANQLRTALEIAQRNEEPFRGSVDLEGGADEEDEELAQLEAMHQEERSSDLSVEAQDATPMSADPAPSHAELVEEGGNDDSGPEVPVAADAASNLPVRADDPGTNLPERVTARPTLAMRPAGDVHDGPRTRDTADVTTHPDRYLRGGSTSGYAEAEPNPGNYKVNYLQFPTAEGPLPERLKFADDILEQLEEREEQRQLDRYAVKPFGRFTPKFMEKGLTSFNRFMNSTNGGKVVKSVGKMVLGTAAVAGTVATGGTLGMVLAPLLFANGTKAAASGAIELAQEFFGKKKVDRNGNTYMDSGRQNRERLMNAKSQLMSQAAASLADLKRRAAAGEFTEDELVTAIDTIAGRIESVERDVIAMENKNIKVEKAREKFRGIASTAIAGAAGVFSGIPFGMQDFDHDKAKHLMTLSRHGLGFNYSPQELLGTAGKFTGQAIMNPHEAASLMGGKFFNPFDLLLRGPAHLIGSGLPPAAIAGLAGMGATVMGRTIMELGKPRQVDSPELYEQIAIWRPEGDLDAYGRPREGYGRDGYGRSGSGRPNPEVIQGDPDWDRPRDIAPLRERVMGVMSPRLKADPNATLNHYQELSEYFGKQDPKSKAAAEALANQVDQPMSPECKLAICVPVAGHQEGKNIYATLESYANQRNESDDSVYDPSKYEIVLFVNHPEDKEPDETLEEIERFKTDHPDMPVRVMYGKLSPEDANMHTIRRSLTDATLMRHHGRGEGAEDMVIISADADNRGVSPYYLSNYENRFATPGAAGSNGDAITGKIDWDPEVMRTNPVLHLASRFEQMIISQWRDPDGAVARQTSPGANFAFKSSIYAAVGGYPEGRYKVGEDNDFRGAIEIARNNGRNSLGYGKKHSIVYTSARRSLAAFEKGYSPTEQWSGVEFGPNDAVRSGETSGSTAISVDEALADPAKAEAFRIGIETMFNRTIAALRMDPADPVCDRGLTLLDVPHTVEDGRIKVGDVTELLETLKEYHDEVAVARFQQNVTPRSELAASAAA